MKIFAARERAKKDPESRNDPKVQCAHGLGSFTDGDSNSMYYAGPPFIAWSDA